MSDDLHFSTRLALIIAVAAFVLPFAAMAWYFGALDVVAKLHWSSILPRISGLVLTAYAYKKTHKEEIKHG